MRSRMIAFLSGIVLFWVIPEITTNNCCWFLLGLVLVFSVALILVQKHPKVRIKLKSFILFTIIGFVIALQQYHFLHSQIDSLPKHTETVTIVGEIINVPQHYPNSTTFEVALKQLEDRHYNFIWRPVIQLSWYYPDNRLPKQGEQWQFNVRIKPIHGYSNPGGFDYERWAFSKRIIAKGYVYSKKPPQLVNEKVYFIENWRRRISMLAQQFSMTNKSLIKSLLIGDKSQLDGDIRLHLQKSGLAHLLAISGLHIGMVALISFLMFNWLWRRSAWLCNHIAAKDSALVLSLMISTVYALLSGWGVPAQRALLMLLIFNVNQLFRLKWSLFNTVLFALMLISMMNPVSILNSSSWLSFGAVFLIVLILRYEKRKKSYLTRSVLWVKFSLMIWLAMLPLSLILFGQIPLLGFISNLIAIPLMSFFIMPILISGAFILLINEPLAAWLWSVAESGLELVIWVSEQISLFSWKGSYPVEHGFILVFIVFLWLIPRALIHQLPRVVLTLSLALLTINFGQFINQKAGATLLVFDVGQGFAGLWEEFNEEGESTRILFDTGYGSKDYQVGNRTWLPYLQQKGITTLDAVIISHNDSDHSGGLSILNNKIAVSELISGQPLKDNIASLNCHSPVLKINKGMRIQVLNSISLDEVELVKDNNASCVVVIEYKNSKILIPGDAENFIEKRLISTHQLTHVDVVIAPHHGSNTSSSEEFVSKLSARDVIFSTGYLNQFKFPRKEVVMRYSKQGSRMHDTAFDGAIRCSWSKNGDFNGCEGNRLTNWGKWHWKKQ